MGVITSDAESHRGDNWRGNEEEPEIERKFATLFDDDTVVNKIRMCSPPMYYLAGKTLFKEDF